MTPSSNAEGFLATNAVMFADTELFVDIYDDATERIYWIGTGQVDIHSPKGDLLTTLSSGEYATPDAGEGTYRVFLRQDQETWWQVNVTTDGTSQLGRLHSYDWHYDTTGTDAGQWASYYVTVPLGDRSTVGVVKAELSGLTGDDLHIRASTVGIPGQAARSMPMADGTPDAELPLYLADPGLGFPTGTLTAGTPSFSPDGGQCEGALSPGLVGGSFSLPVDLDGTWQVTCDTSGDGVFDLSGYTDVIAHHGVATQGTAEAYFDGRDADGVALTAESLTCQVDFLQGAVHVLLGDVTTAYEGVRLFPRENSASFTEGLLFFNDVLVQDQGGDLPYGLGAAAVSSGPDGMSTRAPEIQADPNENAHTWGDYSGTTKGTDAWLDTWLWTRRVTAGAITLKIIDPTADSDGDSLLDAHEHCLLGTKPNNEDSDGDGLLDGEEVDDVNSPRNTDGDDEIDALDDDDDNDDISTYTELVDGAMWGQDFDQDDIWNWHDTDSDGDGIPDRDEPGDADGNGVPDYLQFGGDTGGPDTGPAITDTADATDATTLTGTFRGGSCACGGGGPAGGWLAALVLLAARRRRIYC